MGQSWSDGLFIWDAECSGANDLAAVDNSCKRHSTGASLCDMLVLDTASSGGAGLGARPKVPLLKSRSTLDGVDWRRRPRAWRAQSAGLVLAPHHQLAARLSRSHYIIQPVCLSSIPIPIECP